MINCKFVSILLCSLSGMLISKSQVETQECNKLPDNICVGAVNNRYVALNKDEINRRAEDYKKLNWTINLFKTRQKFQDKQNGWRGFVADALPERIKITPSCKSAFDKVFNEAIKITNPLSCLQEERWLMCSYTLPICIEDKSTSTFIPSLPCQEECHSFLENEACKEIITTLKVFDSIDEKCKIGGKITMLNCSTYPTKNCQRRYNKPTDSDEEGGDQDVIIIIFLVTIPALMFLIVGVLLVVRKRRNRQTEPMSPNYQVAINNLYALQNIEPVGSSSTEQD